MPRVLQALMKLVDISGARVEAPAQALAQLDFEFVKLVYAHAAALRHEEVGVKDVCKRAAHMNGGAREPRPAVWVVATGAGRSAVGGTQGSSASGLCWSEPPQKRRRTTDGGGWIQSCVPRATI